MRFFKFKNERFHFLISGCVLIFSWLITLYVQSCSFGLEKELINLKKQFLEHKKALTIDDKMQTSNVHKADFAISDLESQNLLSHLQKRYASFSQEDLIKKLENNKLQHEIDILSSKGIAKERFVLKNKVLIDEEDLKQILAFVEKRTIFPFHASDSSRFFYFNTFQLSKYPLSFHENVFQLTYSFTSVSP